MQVSYQFALQKFKNYNNKKNFVPIDTPGI